MSGQFLLSWKKTDNPEIHDASPNVSFVVVGCFEVSSLKTGMWGKSYLDVVMWGRNWMFRMDYCYLLFPGYCILK